jgi:uncharacterized membrane protein
VESQIKKYFLTGLLVVVPISLTIYILAFLIAIVEKFLPYKYLPFYIPGLGILITALLILGVGFLTSNYIGSKLVSIGDGIISRIPLVKSIYASVKQISQAVLSQDGKNFRRVVLIEYPRKGLYTLAFVTGVAGGEVQNKTKETVLNIFVPTTPNPTSGFYLMVPENEVTHLDMTTEEAFKLVVSGGMITPPTRQSSP